MPLSPGQLRAKNSFHSRIQKIHDRTKQIFEKVEHRVPANKDHYLCCHLIMQLTLSLEEDGDSFDIAEPGELINFQEILNMSFASIESMLDRLERILEE